jgi:hypothetical protein
MPRHRGNQRRYRQSTLYPRLVGHSGSGPTITEFYGAERTQVPYDPSQSTALFLQQIEQQNSIGGGQ